MSTQDVGIVVACVAGFGLAGYLAHRLAAVLNAPVPPNEVHDAEPPAACMKADLDRPETWDDCVWPVCRCTARGAHGRALARSIKDDLGDKAVHEDEDAKIIRDALGPAPKLGDTVDWDAFHEDTPDTLLVHEPDDMDPETRAVIAELHEGLSASVRKSYFDRPPAGTVTCFDPLAAKYIAIDLRPVAPIPVTPAPSHEAIQDAGMVAFAEQHGEAMASRIVPGSIRPLGGDDPSVFVATVDFGDTFRRAVPVPAGALDLGDVGGEPFPHTVYRGITAGRLCPEGPACRFPHCDCGRLDLERAIRAGDPQA